jgi:hypothetical protein
MADKTAQQIIDDLEAQVTVNKTVEGSAKVLIDGFQARLQAGIDAALAGGATAAQVSVLVADAAALKASSDDLAASVAANTPAA